jgi:CRP-like cAMP-binding protein
MRVLLFYTQTLIAQMSQTAACNRHHTLNQQLCRLLLMINDRIDGNEVLMTQDLLARTLGVRREGVTEAALLLQKSGLIRYARGHITLLDRDGIEKQSCECYSKHESQDC